MYNIKYIEIYTENGVTSRLTLSKGLNVIYGPSNTGKSLILDCIDFLMGSKGKSKNANEESVSYKRLSKPELKIVTISLCLDVNGSEVLLSRRIDANEISVVSEYRQIESRIYSIGKGSQKKPPINRVWLRILGILNDDVKIAMKADGHPQGLTLRTFSHAFLINESRIAGENSILKNGQGYIKNIPIPTISALIYLATEKSFAIVNEDTETSDAVIRAKKSTAKLMYDRSLNALVAQNFVDGIEVNDNRSVAEISGDIAGLLMQLGAAEDSLERTLEKSRILAVDVSSLDDQLAECEMLKNRYASLRTQYESDIRRLTFIAEGDILRVQIPKIEYCPFCNGQLPKKQSQSCVEAANIEVRKIELKIKDLRDADSDIDREIAQLESKRKVLLSEREKIQSLIRGELQPQIDALREKMTIYTAALEKAKAKELVEAFSSILQEQFDAIIASNATIAPENSKVDIVVQMAEYMTTQLTKLLVKILKATNYDNFLGARFDESLCDVVVNGADKMSQGKGFRAFLNAVMAIAVQEWLEEYNLYRPYLLVMDSPILSLKEREEDVGKEVATDGMRSGLFKYLVNHQESHQTIVLENEIPRIEYVGANLVHFTKVEGHGIYGLVSEYRE